jgi:hypothetical protein
LKEQIMKNALIALAIVGSAFTGVAHAAMTHDDNAQRTTASQYVQATMQQAGKTRAEVRQELEQAQKDGEIAALNDLYRGG